MLGLGHLLLLVSSLRQVGGLALLLDYTHRGQESALVDLLAQSELPAPVKESDPHVPSHNCAAARQAMSVAKLLCATETKKLLQVTPVPGGRPALRGGCLRRYVAKVRALVGFDDGGNVASQ